MCSPLPSHRRVETPPSFNPFLCALGALLCALLILYANTIETALSQMKQRVCHTCRTYILYIVTTVHDMCYIADTYDLSPRSPGFHLHPSDKNDSCGACSMHCKTAMTEPLGRFGVPFGSILRGGKSVHACTHHNITNHSSGSKCNAGTGDKHTVDSSQFDEKWPSCWGTLRAPVVPGTAAVASAPTLRA